MYTVLARKYRSQTFDDVIGQDPVARTLKNAIKTDRVAPMLLPDYTPPEVKEKQLTVSYLGSLR